MVRVTKVIGWILLSVLLLQSLGCSVSVFPTPTPASELDDLVNKNIQATIAVAQAQGAQARATSRAEATREFLVLQGQQTRVAQQAQGTQTAQVQNAGATQTIQAIQQTSTMQAARFTATANAQEYAATATTQAAIAQATQVSASATATAHAANAQGTKSAMDAVATRTSEEAATFATKQDMERKTETVRAFGMVLSVVMLTLGAVMVGLYFAYASSSAMARRASMVRDAGGTPYFWDGKSLVAPTRNPGAITRLLNGKVNAEAIDPDVTKRDQAIQLALAGVSLNDPDEGGEEPAAEPVPWQISQAFTSKPLPLHKQPSVLSLPMGTLATGEDMWVPLTSVSHALVAGATGMGKTRFLHAWIQAMLNGRAVDLVLLDGKRGLEFARYAGKPRTTYVEDADAAEALDHLISQMRERNQMLRAAGATDLRDYNNANTGTALSHTVVIIDEIAGILETNGAMEQVITLARESRAAGIHVVSSTQHPDTKTINPQILANAMLRVAFSVPHYVNSNAVLGCGGAQKIGGIVGRMLLSYRGTLVEVQAYTVDLPSPTVKITTLPQELLADGAPVKQIAAPDMPDEVVQMVKYAVRYGKGMFVVTAIAAALGIRPSRVTAAARLLVGRGLLTPVLKNDEGRNEGRALSPQLVASVAR